MAAFVQPSDLLLAWRVDPAVALGLVALGGLWARSRAVAPAGRGRTLAFVTAMAVLVVALVSPLDALAETLVSAHMVQHLLLALVASPLLIAAGVVAVVTRGLPPRLRRLGGQVAGWARRRAGGRPATGVVAVGAYLGVWTAWHLPALYVAAIANPVVHALEHITFVGAGIAFWTVVLRSRPSAQWRGLLALFAATVHGGVLAALLVFAPAAFYADAAPADAISVWGLSAHADQQLAGVIMWIPGGFVYLASAARLVVRWVSADAGDSAPVAAPPMDAVWGSRHAR